MLDLEVRLKIKKKMVCSWYVQFGPYNISYCVWRTRYY